MKIIFLFASLFMLLSSCDRRTDIKRDIRRVLSGKSYKYWTRYVKGSNNHVRLFVYYFDVNGKWKIYYPDYELNTLKNANTSDARLEESWMINNDSSLTVGGSEMIIDFMREDLVVYHYANYRGQFHLYVAAPDSLIPPEFRKFQ